MEEYNTKKLFEFFLQRNNIPFRREVYIKKAIIDYKVEFDRPALVEAKGDRSNIFGAIGQLVNAKRTCSDVFLLAPSDFIKKILEIEKETGALPNIGIIEIQNNEINIIRKPQGEYYYNEDKQKIRKPRAKQNGMYVSEMDLSILNDFDNFLIFDIIKKYNVSYDYAQHIVSRLRRAKLVEVANDGANPRFFKVIRKDVHLDEWKAFI